MHMFSILEIKMSTFALCLLLMISACSDDEPVEETPGPPADETSLAERNLLRSMELVDNTVSAHFTGDGMAMARYYNPYTEIRSEEKGSIWMYTSAIEAVNAVLHALEAQKEHGNSALYNEHFNKYSDLLAQLY